MRRWRYAVPLAVAGTLLAAAPGLAEGPTIEAGDNATHTGYAWKPSQAEIAAGGTIAVANPTSVPHGVLWTGGPAKPACTGVPLGEETRKNWSGSCTFAQAGTYAFQCPIHEEMRATVRVSASAPPPGETPETPASGPSATGLRLAKAQHGGVVRGSIEILAPGAAGTLSIALLAKRAALFENGGNALAQIGKLVRSQLPVGRIPFRVALGKAGKRALRRDGSLGLRVKIRVKSADGSVKTFVRGVSVEAVR